MKVFDIEYLPLNASYKLIDTLRENASILSNEIGVSFIEHESAHYPEGVYCLFVVGGVKVKLHLADDEGKRGWLCVESKSRDSDLTSLFGSVERFVDRNSSVSEVYSR